MSIKSCIKRILLNFTNCLPHDVVTANIVTLTPSDLLKGKLALITGGTSGIGKAIAITFLKAGADVVITSRSEERAVSVAKELEETLQLGHVWGVGLDNSNISELPTKFCNILSLIGDKKIDILVNNAGVNGGHISNCSEEMYQTIMDTNLKGVFFLSKIVSDYMIKNGIKGNILNLASSSSVRPATSVYAISKWGIKGLTIGLAKNLIKHGIVVNGIAPGPTATPMLVNTESNNISLPNNPSLRYAMPEEIANIALVLTSSMGRMIVGDIVYVTGGAGTITVDDVSY